MLSYSAVQSYEKATLPSVEGWNGSMNIIKDPPKGIFTRRKDRVGDTQQILLQQEDSGSRVNEYINVYARNTNPMVSVSYNNYGNSQGGKKSNASLPYKVDVVRPPVMSPYDLLPLSRMPRDWFYASTNPAFPQLVQNLQCNEIKSAIAPNNVNISVNSNKTDIRELFVDRALNTGKIRNTTPLNYSFGTNKGSIKQSSTPQSIPKSILKNPIHPSANTSKKRSGHVRFEPFVNIENSKKPKTKGSLSTNPFVKTEHFQLPQKMPIVDKLQTFNVHSNKSLLKNTIQEPQHIRLDNKTQVFDLNTNQSSFTTDLRPDSYRQFDRKLPIVENMTSNIKMPIQHFETFSSRDKQLLPKLQYGGFENQGSGIPNPNGSNEYFAPTSSIDIEKMDTRKKMQDFFRV